MLDFNDRKNVHAVEYHVNLLAEETGIDYGDCWSDEVRLLMTKIQHCKDRETFNHLMNELDEEMKREIIEL